MRLMTVVGARPQFIKAAVFSRYLQDKGEALGLQEFLVHTGQHYDENMSDIFFRELDIPRPDINLGIGSGTPGKTTGEMLIGLEALMLDRKPDVVLVYGDTNSTLAGALAASKLHIPVAHVEAGLRSYMMVMPEEQNRRLADHLSTWLFCPTKTAVKNLKTEGIHDNSTTTYPNSDMKRVINVGDIMLEASLHYREKAFLGENIHSKYRIEGDFILLTLHRAENTDNPAKLRSIATALNILSEKTILFPVHPRTSKVIASLGIELGSHIKRIEPVGYLDMIALESSCGMILTDSGGVQKEAFFFGKPCITLRDTTEWIELVESGWNTLVSAETDRIVRAVRSVKKPSSQPSFYGDGRCAEKIACELAKGEQ